MNSQLRYYLSQVKLTYVFIGVNFVIFLLINFFGRFNESGDIELFGVLYRGAVLRGDVWRLLWTVFLHADLVHFLFNTYALYKIGIYVENYFGQQKFLLVYVLTGLAASLASILNADMYSVGASGAIFGLLGLLLGNNLRKNVYAMDLPIDTTQLIIIVGINLFLGFTIPQIDNAAHIGGLIAGMGLAYIIDPSITFYTSNLRAWISKGLFYVSLLILVASVILGVMNFITHL